MPLSFVAELVITVVGEVVVGAVGELLPVQGRRRKRVRAPLPLAQVEPFLEGLMLAVALDGRIDPTELEAVRARAATLWPGMAIDAQLERARAAVEHIRTDDEATAAFRAIAARLSTEVRPVLHEAIATLSLLDAQQRPDVPYLYGRALAIPDGETDLLLERVARSQT